MIDTHYDSKAPFAQRWQVRVLKTGEVLYSFRWKKIAVAVGEAVAIERGMDHVIRNRDGDVITRHKYKPVEGGGGTIKITQNFV